MPNHPSEWDEHSVADYSLDRPVEGFGWLLFLQSRPTQPNRHRRSQLFAIDDFGDDAAMVRPYAWTEGQDARPTST